MDLDEGRALQVDGERRAFGFLPMEHLFDVLWAVTCWKQFPQDGIMLAF